MKSLCRSRRTLFTGAGNMAIVAMSLLFAACGHDDDPVSSTSVGNAAAESSAGAVQRIAQFNSSALPESAETDRFIVEFKAGVSQHEDHARVQSRLDRLTAGRRTSARHSHRLPTGADVIVTSRKLTREEAYEYMQQIYASSELSTLSLMYR
ncbi:hypothetical protein EVC45_23010 [Paraburkholderia sp. UYCP14C]|uniref:hypothetical protein n=1 Tax=Paraburkholderia sp. UYCP14C TaxID=2511130 RepID=UPI00101F5496|nr:hypothetical protein [Paraburkholderia sp. UYCP14C]RZF27452.1 hypothetical protein EVC45_23010 [Paraburkholderia sp. UYCP14C]